SHILPVGAKAQVDGGVRAGPARVCRVVGLLVAVVGAIAVRAKAVDRRIESEALGRDAAGELALARVVAACAPVHFRMHSGLERRAGDDVDNTGGSAVSIEHRSGAAQDFYAFNR